MLPIHTNYTIPQASVRRGVQFPTAPEIPPCASSLELASTAGFVRSLLLLVHALSPLVPSRKYRPLFTAAALIDLARAKGVEMPVAEAVADVVSGASDVDGVVARLLARPLKGETE